MTVAESGILGLVQTNNIFTIGFVPKIKVSCTFGTCLKPHNTLPHSFIHCREIQSIYVYGFVETVWIENFPVGREGQPIRRTMMLELRSG
jgi:hypothetical protein